MTSTDTPKQVNDLVNMARTAGWRKLKIELLADVTLSILILVEAMSFKNLRELALLFKAELVDGRFVAGYDGRIALEIIWPSLTAHATYRPPSGPSPLSGSGALLKWGARWRDDIVLAQFDERGTRSDAGVPLWAGWHELPIGDFTVDA